MGNFCVQCGISGFFFVLVHLLLFALDLMLILANAGWPWWADPPGKSEIQSSAWAGVDETEYHFSHSREESETRGPQAGLG